MFFYVFLGAGIGNIGVLDFDIVEITNLHRYSSIALILPLISWLKSLLC